MATPTNVPAIYDSNGTQTGLYVDRYDGMFQVREHGTNRIRSTKLHLPYLQSWLTANGYTCPDIP